MTDIVFPRLVVLDESGEVVLERDLQELAEGWVNGYNSLPGRTRAAILPPQQSAPPGPTHSAYCSEASREASGQSAGRLVLFDGANVAIVINCLRSPHVVRIHVGAVEHRVNVMPVHPDLPATHVGVLDVAVICGIVENVFIHWKGSRKEGLTSQPCGGVSGLCAPSIIPIGSRSSPG